MSHAVGSLVQIPPQQFTATGDVKAYEAFQNEKRMK